MATSIGGRALAALVSTLLCVGGCVPGEALDPLPGVPEVRRPGLVPVPGGWVDAAGGNLILVRSELSVDTLIGRREIRAVYNSATGAWLWSFQVRYDGLTFLDPTGAVHDVSQLVDGAAIPGTVWVKVDARTVASKGGLEHHFAPDSSLESLRWRGQGYPRIEYLRSGSSLDISQCTAPGACGPVFALSLDAAGNPLDIADARTGRTAELGYDALGRLATARSPADVEEGRPGLRYEYDVPASDLIAAVVSSEGERIEYAYQGERRIRSVRQVGEGHPTHRFEFQAMIAGGLFPTLHTNPLGGQTRYHFDAERRLRSVEQVETGDLTAVEWEGMRPSRLTTPSGISSTYEHADDDLVRLVQPSGNAVDVSYEPAGVDPALPFARPLRRVDDALGPVLVRSYDAAGRLASSANGEGEAFTIAYGPATLTSVESPAGASWTFPLYGVHGHWLRLQGAAEDRREIDPVGNLLVESMGDQPGGFLRRGWDADRNLASIEVATSVDGEVTSQASIEIERRSDGRPLSISRPGGADHAFEYDALGRLRFRRERVDGAWQTTAFEYDAAGNPTARTLPNGMREERLYDAHGRLLRRRALRDGVLEGDLLVAWQQGRVAAIYDSIRDVAEILSYDAAGRVAVIDFTTGESATIEYDPRSRIIREVLSLPAGGPTRSIEYTYDLADRPLRVSTEGELLAEWSYRDGELESVRYGNGLEREFGFDPASGALLWAETRDAAGALLERTDVAWSAEAGPSRLQVRAEVETPLATSVEEYWLELGGSLTRPEGFVGRRVFAWNDGGSDERRYAYDGLSNRIPATAGDAFSYNAEGNRLLSATLAATGTTIGYAWDEAGFATQRDGVPITWTATGRMASYGDAELEWDMRGRPISIDSGGVARVFRLFGGRIEGDLERGAGFIDLGEVAIPFEGETRVFRHFDFRGNTRFESDETGALLSHRHYSAYALEADYGGGAVPGGLARGTPLDDLTLLGARVYDSTAGRFLSPDPVFQLANAYAYTLGNPVQYWDPDGAQQAPAGVGKSQVRTALGVQASVLGLAAAHIGAGVVVATVALPPAVAAFAAAAAITSGVVAVALAIDAAIDAWAPRVDVPFRASTAVVRDSSGSSRHGDATRDGQFDTDGLLGLSGNGSSERSGDSAETPSTAAPAVSVCAPTHLHELQPSRRAAHLLVALQLLVAGLWIGRRMRGG